MISIDAYQLQQNDWVLQATNRDGSQPTQFLASDTVIAEVWQGGTNAALFNPAAAWYAYATGQVSVSVTAAQMTGLDASGNYTLLVTVTRGSVTAPIIEATFRVLPTPGTASQALKTYCAYTDLLQYAPWIRQVQDLDTDQESFYSQRYEARIWLDWLIVRSWRGTSAAYFGDAGRSAQFWLGSWVRRTPLPSYWLLGQLSGGFVMSGTVASGGSNYTNPTVTVPAPSVTPAYGNQVQAAVSAVTVNGVITSLFVTQQGAGYVPGSTLTLTFTDATGSGATATATVSNGTLLVRPETSRITAYYALGRIGLAQIGQNNQLASYGAMFRDLASAEVASVVAELDLNGDGIADLPIPISPTNTMFT